MDLLYENSIKSTSKGLEKLLNEIYKDEIEKNLNENSSVSNISSYAYMIRDVIKRAKAKSVVDKICSVIPIASSEGRAFSFGNKLTGSDTASIIVTDKVRIISVNDSSLFNEEGVITSASGTGTVLYKDSEQNLLLVKIETGVIIEGEDLDNVSPFATAKDKALKVLNAIHLLGSILPDYNGPYAVEDGEEVVDFKDYDFQMNESQVKCKTRFGKSNLTVEAIEDLVSIYGVRYRPTFIAMLSKILEDIQKHSVFRYQRANAYNRGNIALTNSYGVNGGLDKVYSDIYTRINRSIGNIGTNTGIEGNYSVIASSNVVAALTTYLKDSIKTINGINYLPGNVALIEDGYSIEDYFTVTLIGPDDNGAVLLTPYSIDVVEVQDPDDFKKKLKLVHRYDIVNNPLATKVNDQNKNEMMEVTYVDFSNLSNF